MRTGPAWWLFLTILATPIDAQRRQVAGVHRPPPLLHACAEPRTCDLFNAGTGQSNGSRSPWAIAASAVLPGSGQAMLGVERALPYLAVEAFAWTAYVKASQDYRRRRNGYRDLASRVARAPFTAVRPNGSFEYYERITVRDSSLSACIQGVVAAEVGHLEPAYDYLAERQDGTDQ